ncbi:UDP-N-acetylglucosamine 2-epimerase, partial [candidate division WOR-3 bacterium]|nr:UDP-N-acetylglucosamine 2-epimerase [candidate division WOR-3 bacterium]
MQNKKIDLIVGARPNFVKCTVLYDVLKKRGFTIRLIHTGQHYDEKMSDIFFKDLNIPKEDINLNVGSSSHAVQTGMIMQKYEELLYKEKCDLVIVFGDVNSTVASVITAAKLHIKTAHVEAGLRSYDRSMPEEINRLATDSISDYLFAPDMGAVNNLKKEGHTENVFLAGNIMIDTLKKHIEIIENYNLSEYNIINKKYIYMTLHRPFNVDNKDRLRFIIDFINK